ncbi:MAG: LysM peptidoglycan-binding domain-containing protein [Anaerolineales bacterium]
MSVPPRQNTSPSRVCPSCGTRLAETAVRCAVCGTQLQPQQDRPVLPARLAGISPGVSLGWPTLIGGAALFMIAGALVIAFLTRTGHGLSAAIPTLTPTVTSPPTDTQFPTNTPAPTPTLTPLPPISYIIAQNDTCLGLAIQYNVSVQSILQLNNLPPSCNNLVVGQKLLIPQPTQTPLPPSTATYTAAEATITACQLFPYTVVAGDTLAGIAANFNVSMDSVRKYNQNIYGDTVFSGLTIEIPLCERLPTPGPTPTATTPPPYPAPNLLTPRDGSVFGLNDQTIALQWAAVAQLRENEFYQVTVEDLTEGSGHQSFGYVSDTKYDVPATLRPTDSTTHLFRWSVSVVRQTGTTPDGQPIYTSAGAESNVWDFGWSGGQVVSTPTP